ncbi:SIMPL domain-containing protein [Alcaligenaceae bacterium]|nr:SIMPL domain-containing protein [Alcaligenaceae bacterium]
MYLSRQSRKWLSGIALCIGAGALVLPASAQQSADTETKVGKWPQASLRAEASAEVPQDSVKITLATEVSDASQTAVAKALSKALESVMTDAKGNPKIKVSSGNYHVWPMNNDKGKISNWRGRGEIFLESTDFGAASELAGKLSDRMPVANLAFSVSPQERAKQEQALLAQAAQAFQARAQALANAFGYAGYTVRSIDLNGAGAQPYPQAGARMMSMAADKASVPLEGGTAMVTVSIQGSIFLHSTQK